ncbi:hypothetical protein NIES4071_23800 [Calothrix sp. NIES-4071]|nr:hypothetical protein NIES4071_23800 [Calothrix sp. NIES-4071]BAZ56704.1 hypothetical protein NIES4105_23750 [Calothrix sp. NIES-4105]
MAKNIEIQAHKEWLGFLQPVGLVVSPPALVTAQASVNKNIVKLQQKLLACVNRENGASISDFPAFTIEGIKNPWLIAKVLLKRTNQKYNFFIDLVVFRRLEL